VSLDLGTLFTDASLLGSMPLGLRQQMRGAYHVVEGIVLPEMGTGYPGVTRTGCSVRTRAPAPTAWDGGSLVLLDLADRRLGRYPTRRSLSPATCRSLAGPPGATCRC
jgi:hypothetical protein